MKSIFFLGSSFLSASIIAAEIPIEEIVVTPEISFSSLRIQLEAAEENMFALFNELVENEEFEIICENVIRAGRHLNKRECEPGFIISARRGDFRQGMSATGDPFEAMTYVRTDKTLNNHLTEKRQEMESLIVDIAIENPRLFDAIMEIRELKEELSEAKNERFGD